MKLRSKVLNFALAIGFILSLGMTNSVMAQNLGGIIIASIGVIGPQGEVISYEKRSGEIFIRQCAKNTLPSEIESGCRLKEGTQEIQLDVESFRKLVSLKLKTLLEDSTELSEAQRMLLVRYFVDLSQHEQDLQRLSFLQKKLEENQAFKKEFPEDYDAVEEKALNTEIQAIEARLSGIEDIRRAKAEMASLIDALIADMNEREIRRLLKHSTDREGIAFQLLKSIISVKVCDLETNRNQDEGFMCHVETDAGSAFWQLHTKTDSGKVVWTNLESGLLVSDILDKKYNHYQAENVCTDSSSQDARGNLMSKNWRLPSRSDFETLEANGIRKVINTSGRYFWSSSVYPYVSGNAYYFSGSVGDIVSGNRVFFNGSVRCVGR